MKKRLVAVVLSLAMVLGLAACGGTDAGSDGAENAGGTQSAEAESGEAYDFYFISLMSGGAAWSQAERGFYDACEEFGVNGQYLAPVERNNAVEMAELLDKAVVAEADAAFGVFLSTDMFGPALLKAREQGMVTGSVQLTLPEEYIDFQIGTDQAQVAKEMANAIIEYADGKEVSVMFMCGAAGEVTNIQFEAFEAALEGHDNITSFGMRFDEGSAATANQILTDEFRSNPQLNAVVCLDSSAATIGTASFIQENGLEDEWITIGIDASADILNYVKDGALDATLNQDFYAMGYNCVKMAYEKLENGTEPEFLNDSGCYLIRPEEVDQYAADNGIELN